MEKSACNVKLSKDEKKLAKEKKKAETLQKFHNKPKFNNTVEKKINLKTSDKSNVDIKTLPGSKKDVGRDLPKTYCPLYTEEGWFSWWEAQGYFKPEYSEKKSDEKFVMMIPPPNVTGILHIGHALTISIEDCVVRWNRMLGKQTLWLPGTDHAGIATQTVVEKKILRETNQNRHDLGRESFIKEIWKWKEEKGNYIIDQLKRLGSSCDFSRLRFTMDPAMNKAVIETFIRLYEDGLIYRAKRLVNWSCSLKSAISDIEVEKVEIAKRTFVNVPNYDKPIEFGCMCHFAYEVTDTKEKIYVGTTRLETMLGDTGLAVHPEDARYVHLHGKFVSHPFVKSRSIPIICDTFVDKEFGTGAVKITPAHDHNDYEVGLRHNLEFINIFSDDGRILEGYGEFSGMKRFDARRAIQLKLEQLGLYDKTTDNAMVIPMCSKSKDIIEPMIKKQWYLKCKTMATEALRVVQDGELKLLPEGVHEVIWQRWMEDCHDWCISRQLWWGHQIPMYNVTFLSEHEVSEDKENWIAARSPEEALKLVREKYNVSDDMVRIEQDPDVLDTWFSSQLFPFATIGWPDNTDDLAKFYPGNLLETGHDIIFFWVARMVMIGLKMMGRLPFDTVYLHAMIRDAHGRKMSKSLGNVLNPYDIIHGITLNDLQKSLENGNLDPRELAQAKATQAKDFPLGIPECGTDALRFAMLAYTNQARDINLDVLRVKGYRNFCNKIWQAFKFCQMFGVSKSMVVPPTNPLEKDSVLWHESLSVTDIWILSCLSTVVNEMNDHFTNYNFSAATTSIYRFWLYEFCDVYIEYAKRFRSTPRQSIIVQVLYQCVEVGLRLLHPMMPFITEELYQRLPFENVTGGEREDSIMVMPYPKSDKYIIWYQCDITKNMEIALDIVRRIRSYRKEKSMLDKQVLSINYRSIDDSFCQDFIDDIIIPLSNSKLTQLQSVGEILILSNLKLEVFTGIELLKKTVSDEIFTIRTTEEQKQSLLKELRFGDRDLSEMETVLVKQWCNWLNGQAVKGKIGLKDTLDFVNERLVKDTFISGHKFPTVADSLLLYYLNSNKVSEALLGKYSNLKRWHETVKNYQ